MCVHGCENILRAIDGTCNNNNNNFIAYAALLFFSLLFFVLFAVSARFQHTCSSLSHMSKINPLYLQCMTITPQIAKLS